MKIKLSLFFVFGICVSNAVQFSKQEVKNIQIVSRRFFENLKNKKICIPQRIISSYTTTKEKNESNGTRTVEYPIFI